MKKETGDGSLSPFSEYFIVNDKNNLSLTISLRRSKRQSKKTFAVNYKKGDIGTVPVSPDEMERIEE